MADLLKDALDAQGFATVMVTLKRPTGMRAAMAAAVAAGVPEALALVREAVEDRASKLVHHFSTPANARPLALAAALGRRKPRSSMRLYRNLGLLLGVVDAKGLINLRK